MQSHTVHRLSVWLYLTVTSVHMCIFIIALSWHDSIIENVIGTQSGTQNGAPLDLHRIVYVN